MRASHKLVATMQGYSDFMNQLLTLQNYDLYFLEGKSQRILRYIFADHQVEYIVSLSHSFFLRIKISL